MSGEITRRDVVREAQLDRGVRRATGRGDRRGLLSAGAPADDLGAQRSDARHGEALLAAARERPLHTHEGRRRDDGHGLEVADAPVDMQVSAIVRSLSDHMKGHVLKLLRPIAPLDTDRSAGLRVRDRLREVEGDDVLVRGEVVLVEDAVELGPRRAERERVLRRVRQRSAIERARASVDVDPELGGRGEGALRPEHRRALAEPSPGARHGGAACGARDPRRPRSFGRGIGERRERMHRPAEGEGHLGGRARLALRSREDDPERSVLGQRFRSNGKASASDGPVVSRHARREAEDGEQDELA